MDYSPGRSQEDQTEDNDETQVKIQGVQGDLELGVDLGEPLGERETTITIYTLVQIHLGEGKGSKKNIPCEGVAHTAASSHDSSCGEQHANQRETKPNQ